MNDVKEMVWECGNEVIATLSGTTLTISGEGKMRDYDRKRFPPPWHKESITGVIIKQGVKSIGMRAFLNCMGITSITIPESVRDIGFGAFEGCTGLKIVINYNLSPQLLQEKIGYNPHRFKIDDLEHDIKKTLDEMGRANNSDSLIGKIRLMRDELRSYQNMAAIYENRSPFDDSCSETIAQSSYAMTLYVPKLSLQIYKSAPVWKNFESIEDIPQDALIPQEKSPEENSEESLKEEIHRKEKELDELRWKLIRLRGIKGNPNDVAQFMSLFNQPDKLKYLTHDFDLSSEFDIESFLTQIRTVFNENVDQLKIPKTLTELLNQFAFEKKPRWKSFDREYNPKEITSGWSAFDWEEKGNGLHPIKHPEFAEIIKDFKRAIRIESPNLEMLINKIFIDNAFDTAAIVEGNTEEDAELASLEAEKVELEEAINGDDFEEDIKEELRAALRALEAELREKIAKATKPTATQPKTTPLTTPASNLTIERKDLSKIDFYTHVGNFYNALQAIFEEIQQRGNTPDKKKVSVEYRKAGANDDFLIRNIVITHHNSYPTRDDEDLIKDWLALEKGNMGKIARLLQGYFHWSVITKINDKPVKINILREKGTPEQEDIDASEVKGFTHILTFYNYQS